MGQSNKNKNRKEFLVNLVQGGLIASLIFGMPIKKLWSMTKNPKIYFKENPESVKRQK